MPKAFLAILFGVVISCADNSGPVARRPWRKPPEFLRRVLAIAYPQASVAVTVTYGISFRGGERWWPFAETPWSSLEGIL